MKLTTLGLFLSLSLCNCLAADAPELKAILARYDRAKLAHDEPLREKFVTELAILRWDLAQHRNQGWMEVDAELKKYPAPADTMGYAKARAGTWWSPRHSYLYRSDGTWVMDPDAGIDDATHGKWSIDGNHYIEQVAIEGEAPRTYTIILLDGQNFIFCDKTTTFYETRPGPNALLLRIE